MQAAGGLALDQHIADISALGNRPGVGWGPADDIARFITSGAFLNSGELRSIRPGASLESVSSARRQIFGSDSGDHVTDLLRFDMQVYLVDLLTRQDKMTMAHAVENRVPFLDHQLVERIFELPTEHLVRWRPRLSALRSRETMAAERTKVVLKELKG